MRVAFLTSRMDKPSFRFRVAQYLPFLEKYGVKCDTFTIPAKHSRRWNLFRRLSDYDLVFLQKRMFRLVDRIRLRRSARRLVFDVDDALMYKESGFRAEQVKRRVRLFRAMVKMSDMVLAGNDFLCSWAANYALRVVTLPTAVDTDRYVPSDKNDGGPFCIGWIGSHSTNHYLNLVLPVLERVSRSYRIRFRIVSDTVDGIDLSLCGGLEAEFSAWNQADEVEELRSFDIGIMPLPDNGWARGKCALKALLYMACAIPAVCSPVGMVKRLITDGHDGFLASSEDEWYGRIERLLEDRQLRRAIGGRGRNTVVNRYSVSAQAPRLLKILSDLTGRDV